VVTTAESKAILAVCQYFNKSFH